ncbi:CBS domain-containing protein [Marinimicrococcus flavescens]|uniref:CBS domain-containing protein n=1 Tax=Marinimicrococcus flavescens TaxID=3031815 RepID=A0AAP3XPC8_9PROT|nr:CBS domain-containing protein [Marinimicrococcus flavescens]
MRVREILDAKGRNVVTIRGETAINTALHRLALERIGALVVSEDGSHLDGILSERDVIQALARHGVDILEPGRRVSEIMTRAVQTCAPDDSVKELMERMTRLRIRHLPVLDGGMIAGIVSIGDVVKNRLDEVSLEADLLREAYIVSH